MALKSRKLAFVDLGIPVSDFLNLLSPWAGGRDGSQDLGCHYVQCTLLGVDMTDGSWFSPPAWALLRGRFCGWQALLSLELCVGKCSLGAVHCSLLSWVDGRHI